MPSSKLRPSARPVGAALRRQEGVINEGIERDGHVRVRPEPDDGPVLGFQLRRSTLDQVPLHRGGRLRRKVVDESHGSGEGIFGVGDAARVPRLTAPGCKPRSRILNAESRF